MLNIMPLNFEEANETKPVPKGLYDLQIVSAELVETGENSKHPGAPMIKVGLGFEDESLNATNVYHYITLPFEGDENANFKTLMYKRFLTAFHIPFQSGDVNIEQMVMEMPGHSAKLEVNLTEPNENGDIFNRVQIPKIRDEVKHRR